ncbi:MAG: hypothetical protein KH354_09005 [Clostridiales bacterium]|nr:hypothetical protein [Clostridiales bacterium]
MGNSGYIKLQRSLKNWEHYDDPYALKLLVHLLLSVAFVGYFDGDMYVDRGQMLIGIRSLAQELNFTYQRTRTLLSTLEATHTLTQKSTRRGTLITIVKWDVFQASVKKINAASNADFSAASNAPTVKNQRTHYIKECIKEIQEDKEDNKENIIKEKKKSSAACFNEIISGYSSDGKTVDLLKEWIKVRKAKRAAMTERAIQMNLDKLDGIAKESGMTVCEYLSEVICRGWAAFYPIRQYRDKQSGKVYGANGIAIDPNAADDFEGIF